MAYYLQDGQARPEAGDLLLHLSHLALQSLPYLPMGKEKV